MRQIFPSSRFSKWDGTQTFEDLADQFLSEMANDILDYGDISWSMRNLIGRGLRDEDGQYRQGLRSMRKQLRDLKSERLNQFDLSSVLRNIEKQLEEILSKERSTIKEYKEKADDSSLESEVLPEFFRKTAEEHEQQLSDLPEDAAGQMKGLEDYEFLNPEAQEQYNELLGQLRDAITDKFFKNLADTLNNMSEADMQRMKDMLKSLNEMLSKQLSGEEDTGFEQFMDEFGDMFGDNPPESLDDLLDQMGQNMAAAQSMLQSMSFQQRNELQSLLDDRFSDPDLETELDRLASSLSYLGAKGHTYRFRGSDQLDLESAMQLMDEMHQLDELIGQLQRAENPEKLDDVDRELLRKLLDDDAANSLDELSQMKKVLEEAGYIRKNDQKKWEFTPKGSRLIAYKALNEIYTQLKKHQTGNHAIPEEGQFGERLDQSKLYEFGDPMHLHLPRTIRNALDRTGPKIPMQLKEEDFEVYRSELITSTATAILVDCSWSMFLRDAFRAAKKVALALHHLIQTQYPKDSLYVVIFSEYAREITPHDLPVVDSDQYVMGTNMQHAFLLAEKLLRKHTGGSKQILMISDGEPTAHLHKGHARFAYPPTRETILATYKAVKHCTQKGIAINTFMLDSSPFLKQFVDEIARINGGRVFFTSPYKLGEYILVDYLRNKRTLLRRSA